MAKTAQSSLIVIFQLVIRGLTSLIFVFGTVSLQFQVYLFPFLAANAQNCGSSSPGHSLVNMQLTSPSGVLVLTG